MLVYRRIFIILSFGQKRIFADISVKNAEISSKLLEISDIICYNTKYKYKVSVTMSGTESDQSAESAEITAQP